MEPWDLTRKWSASNHITRIFFLGKKPATFENCTVRKKYSLIRKLISDFLVLRGLYWDRKSAFKAFRRYFSKNGLYEAFCINCREDFLGNYGNSAGDQLKNLIFYLIVFERGIIWKRFKNWCQKMPFHS